jgi:hypothetical protein
MSCDRGKPGGIATAAALACLAGLLPGTGCYTAPPLVLVDRATALEHQAAGSFVDLERKLRREGIAARPVPLTAEDLVTLGIQPPPLVDEIDLSEAERIDNLLQQHCVGETREGLLIDTHKECKTSADEAATHQLIERVNRARGQLWSWMKSRQPKADLVELKRSWRKAHLRGVICGGWLQNDDGSWEAKKC